MPVDSSFTPEELETIEAILTEYGYDWAQTSVESRLVGIILDKLEYLLNEG